MISAVAQTLANVLAVGTSLAGLEQISLASPDTLSEKDPGLNLYFYDVRQREPGESTAATEDPFFYPCGTGKCGSFSSDGLSSLSWLDVSFVITAQNRTSLGMQKLLSEALTALLRHRSIPQELMAPTLHSHEPLLLSLRQPSDVAGFWAALKLPLRPAIFVSVTVPLRLEQLSQVVSVG